jgi:regulator of protease activity HflC (stomatin/prohibitin superfamily)
VAYRAVIVVTLVKTAQIVPQRSAYIVERLGRYSRTLDAGFHILIPFIDRVAYRQTLKEEALDVPKQQCITKDNISVSVDGVLYLQVHRSACRQLRHLRLPLRLDEPGADHPALDHRPDRAGQDLRGARAINEEVVKALDEAAQPWGVKVMRYEIADIVLPGTITDALEQQMRAERERRAVVARSEGERQEKINISEGEKMQIINLSEAEKQKADQRGRRQGAGDPDAGGGHRRASSASPRINQPGGKEAVSLRNRRAVRARVRSDRAERNDTHPPGGARQHRRGLEAK